MGGFSWVVLEFVKKLHTAPRTADVREVRDKRDRVRLSRLLHGKADARACAGELFDAWIEWADGLEAGFPAQVADCEAEKLPGAALALHGAVVASVAVRALEKI